MSERFSGIARLRQAYLLILLAIGSTSWSADVKAASRDFADAQVDSVVQPVVTRDDKIRLKSQMALLGTGAQSGLRAWQRHKTPRTAMFSNMLLPGLGQVYNGRRIKTVLMVGLGTFYMSQAITENRRKVRRRKQRESIPLNTAARFTEDAFVEFHRANSRDFMWWFGATWLIGALDAFIDAHLFDIRSVDPAVIRRGDNNYFGFSADF